MPCTLVDVWVWRRGGLWCTYCPVWWAQSILVTWAFLPALYISVASVGGGFGRLTETSTCSVHNISVEVVVCLFLVPFFFFKLRMGVTLHTRGCFSFWRLEERKRWTGATCAMPGLGCCAARGMCRGACASWFVHSVCQVSSGEISLVFEKLSNCTCWVECNTGACNFAPLVFCGC